MRRLTVRQKSVQSTMPLPAISRLAVSADTAAASWAMFAGRKYCSNSQRYWARPCHRRRERFKTSPSLSLGM